MISMIHWGMRRAALSTAMIICGPLLAQNWQASGGNALSTAAGVNVGIGTPAPVSQLQVFGNSTMTQATVGPTSGPGTFDILALTEWGAQGFADLSSNLYFNGSSWYLRDTSNDGWMLAMNTFPGGPGGGWGVYHVVSGNNPATLTPVFNITPAGNVGIGTTTPQYTLAVNGTIGAQKVIVTASGWPDRVFESHYHLMPLGEISRYIDANHHLPGVPSEAEVKNHGIDVGEVQAKLLEKVEELTLHVIAEHDRNDRIERENHRLQHENQAILQRLAELEAGRDAGSRGTRAAEPVANR